MTSLRRSRFGAICAVALLLGINGPAPAVAPVAPVADVALLGEEWSWREFYKYWARQFGKTSGVLGTVGLVAGAAVIIIISQSRR